MDLKAIEKLLNKYLEAETSLKEEAQLKQYFRSGTVASHLQEYIPLFNYYTLAKEERFSGEMNFETGRKKVYSWVAIAASIALLAGIFTERSNNISEFGSYEDPEMALQKTKEALQMISLNMNTGSEDLLYLQEFNIAKDKILK